MPYLLGGASLNIIDSSCPPVFQTPIKRINQTEDVQRFLASEAYRDIGLFILQLNRAICPRQLAGSSLSVFPLGSKATSTGSIQSLQTLLSCIRTLIGKAPPDPGSHRFGNVSFRTWFRLLTAELDNLLDNGLLAGTLRVGNGHAKDEVASYLLGSFGSPQRLDYGTGHELNFIAFLGCLWKLGHFKDGIQGGHIEREIVLLVIEPYIDIVRQLITTYTLEPAGSHGVWGLDDHSFIPYIFGSGQLTRPIISEDDPMPTDGSVRGAPKPSDITNPSVVEDMRQRNMYFSAVAFINDVKKGPFWEHSPMLFDISGIKDGWGKINKGMIKMFNAEVLSKFPVIQHFPFGTLFAWDENRPTLDSRQHRASTKSQNHVA
ncbi:serine/threonine-protein phosphatase 2A activator 1 [Trichoderma gamsii]|uniref:Serine/threonine-protein phosphatase 2A activator n=1 Tax=Trichoderma gamsii TaxID=398673 RepID=A0A2P4ZHA1_9HYPO|nr:serine/threonine-protein phosphatase 2A activator 1 [Trichoderma gamsii]PON23662.1 serine/threonine-protein phosphatase 2A activator 1 [Trichoderma gamsii]